ncbi:hypothetical protein CDO26_21895 (plasmid) [Sinorhizobium meliloti]|nr:hypothetical protein CDO26_21895 [Sinorhizobium meliloti]MQW27153.1 hypothetical protein [Sinorhizobium meliloti]RVJ62417.1 hypothetical protein CN171_35515 [Sinorhizobium meliloti]
MQPRVNFGYRRQNGSQVFLFAPGSEKTNSYNALGFIRPERGNRERPAMAFSLGREADIIGRVSSRLP